MRKNTLFTLFHVIFREKVEKNKNSDRQNHKETASRLRGRSHSIRK
jgi:hypothetical protein